MILKNDPWNVERIWKTFENLNSFLDDVENAKNDANILKMYFFGFSLFFCYFFIFQKFIKKMGKNCVVTDTPSLQCLPSKNPQCFA